MPRGAFASWSGEVGTSIWDAARWLFTRAHASVPVIVVWTLIAAFYLVNADWLLGEQFARVAKWSIMVYIVLVLVFAFQSRDQNPFQKLGFGEFLGHFALAFIPAAVILAGLFHSTGFRPPEIPVGATTNVVLWFILFIIAFPEELIFRDLLPRLLALFGLNKPIAAQFVGAFLFAIFHVAAYQGSKTALIFAWVAGFIFGLVREGIPAVGTRQRKPHGLVYAIALHTAYNAAVFGVY